MLSVLHDALLEYVGFLGAFATIGAVGFRYGVLASADRLGEPVDNRITRRAARTAAVIGVIGAILATIMFVHGQAERAADHGHTLTQALTSAQGAVPLALVILSALGFALATADSLVGWPLAAVTTLAFALKSIASLKWQSMVNPLHIIGGSLWIGTLAVLVIAGLSVALGASLPAEQRGPLVSRWVTAFRHLKSVAALWTTTYGFTLDAKLCAVATVVLLGAWNWRRLKPNCHTEPGARELQHAARTELAMAAVVLVITGILVSVPSPKLPH
jgi:putative copper export protein